MRLIYPILLGVLCAAPQLSADSLKDVLTRMDKNAQAFQGMTADLTQVNHTEVINEDDKQNATVRMKRSRDGIVGRVDFSGPNQKILGIRERKLRVFYPKTNVVELYDVGKYGEQLDQFLLLGFSTSGKELQRNYKVRLVGTETMAGQPVVHLELKPKSKEAQNMFTRADLWLAQAADRPAQEKIFKNDQDYTLITYTNIKLNPVLSDRDLELVLPPGVKTITPQK